MSNYNGHSARSDRGRGRVRRRVGIVAAATIAGVALGIGGSGTPAHAYLWSPSVTLNGSISCPAWGGPFDRPDGGVVYGYSGDWGVGVGISGTGWTRQYSAQLNHVPSGSAETVDVWYHCSATGWHDTWFGVNRPAVGSYATRNIY